VKYSVIIPTYNHCDKFLKPCIEAILKYSHIKDIELIVSANGCTDNTFEYLGNLKDDFVHLGLENHFKIVWNNQALGYAKAVNVGIKESTSDMIVLLNNDAILLPQEKNHWLQLLSDPFENDLTCGITGSLTLYSEIIDMLFAPFFCVMLSRKIVNEIGLLDEQFLIGGNEDIDYCARIQQKGYKVVQPVPMAYDKEIELHVGTFPLWHQGEGTVHDSSLVPEFEKAFRTNELKLALKYNNISWYEKYKNSI